VPAWALGGNKSSGEVHGYPLDLLDPYFEDPSEGEPNIAVSKAQRPAFDKRARARTDLLPGPGAAAVDLDAYTRASVLLEGEQNTKLPCLGCEQYAAPCAPQPPSFLPSPILPPSSDTRARGITPGEGAAPVRRAADPRLEALKPPNPTPPEEPGGAGLGPVHAAGKAGAKAVERAVVDAHEPGGASLDANAAPVPTKGIAGVEPASGAVEATTARPEALEPREKRAEWSELQLPPPLPPPPRVGPGKPGSPPREAPSMGTCRRGLEAPPSPPREGVSARERRPKRAPQRTPPPPPREDSGYPGSPPREAPRTGIRRRDQPPREGPSAGKRGPQWAPRNTPRAGVLAAHEGAPLVLRDSAPGFPKQGPPWDIEGEPGGTRPFEADNEGDDAGHFGHHEKEPGRIQTKSVQGPPQRPGHLPRACTRHRGAAFKPPAIFALRPIERAHSWQRRRTRWQRGHLRRHEHVTPSQKCV